MKRQPDRPAWRSLCAAAAVVVLFGAAGISLNVAWIPSWTGIDASGALPAQVELTVHAVRRCPHCGWIESKREILPNVADPHAAKIYEYTARMVTARAGYSRSSFPPAGALESA